MSLACMLSHFGCVWLCDSMACSLPGSSVMGFLQAGIMVGVAMPSSGDLPNPAIEPMSLRGSKAFWVILDTLSTSPFKKIYVDKYI